MSIGKIASKSIVPADHVIARMVELAKLFPNVKQLQGKKATTVAFWKKFFNTNDQTRRALEALREAPLLTSQAPKRGDGEALKKAWTAPFGNLFEMFVGDLARMATQTPLPPKKLKYWRERFGPEEWVQRVRPVESNEYLPNPHRGTTTFQRFQGDPLYGMHFWSDTHGPTEFAPDAPVVDNEQFIPRTTLTYVRWPWSWLEPEKGKFRWDLVDQSLLTAHNRGQTVQLRFEPYTWPIDYSQTPAKSKRHPPEKSVNMPDWYWDTGAAWQEIGGYYTSHEPDANDPLYIRHFSEFVRAFAARYDGHPDLESVDIAYGGFWGEGGGNATEQTAATLAEVYVNSFKKTQLVGMLGTPGMAHAVAITRGAANPTGWRADCFGDLARTVVPEVPMDLTFNHTNDVYPKCIAQCKATEVWKSAPVTMETCGTVQSWFTSGYDFNRIISEGYKYHMSVFMPKSVYFPHATMEQLIEFDKKIGYRFVLRQILLPLDLKAGAPMPLEFYLDNVGCAPIYRPYPLALRFRQPGRTRVVRLTQDIRTWLPGIHWFSETIAVPSDLKPGEAKVDLGIVNMDSDTPRVRFANEGNLEDGWHPLTSIEIL
jgi:hypothetical protein